MATKSIETSIIEEKEELMVDHTSSKITQNPTKRSAHFLKPTLNPNALPPKLPKIQSFSFSSKPNLLFKYNSVPLKGWKTWLENLEETHEPEWRKAGIFDAIRSSTYYIAKHSDLIFSLVEKWCPETNTFVFPWGEATVTLEDVFVLGGFSPLGVSVSSSSLGEDVEHVENKLIKSYRKLKENDSNLSQIRWQKHFMGKGGQIEYAGFVALWLARHVFPGKNNSVVRKTVFAMAARISCGFKLALGPAVLASLYRDLTVLKSKIVDCLRGRYRGGSELMKVSSQFLLLQVWAWERFPSLGPVPKTIYYGEMRLVRWECNGRNLFDRIGVVRRCLDSARDTFRWRPYGMALENWSLPRFYVDSGTWVVVNSDEEWKLIARCLMVGELEGLDCVERYNPHRVALQFGFDQDIPESFDGSKADWTLSGVGYRKNKGLKLYLPPRLHEGDVTHRYSTWWRAMVNVVEEEALVGFKRKKRTGKRAMKMAKTCDRRNKLEAIDVAENIGEKSLNKSPHIEESSQNLLQDGNDIDMTIGLNPQEHTLMLEDKENQMRTENPGVGEGNNDSDHSNLHRENMGNKMNISCSKLAEIKANRSVEEDEDNMTLSEMFLKRKQRCDAMNSLCLQVAAENQNLGNEIGQVMVRCPMIQPEGGSGKSEDVASREQNKEQNLTEHNVKMEMNLECLESDIPLIKTPTETNVDNDNGYSTFAALCLNYEARISRLEKETRAVSASNLSRLAITG